VRSFYYRFTVEFAGEAVFKICEHFGKLQARRLIVSQALWIWAVDTVLHKDNSPSILRTSWRNCG